ncbi:hypothetical protein EB796_021026 [Bugula neritina]|uniref:Uncharacterized protein n=1 Tax=Bugula neritina TaxID=10212 RepID=A0A7J7J4R9_BUGNE|nr:hypothetical protein EB796_021026 [Bugula neritina]
MIDSKSSLNLFHGVKSCKVSRQAKRHNHTDVGIMIIVEQLLLGVSALYVGARTIHSDVDLQQIKICYLNLAPTAVTLSWW